MWAFWGSNTSFSYTIVQAYQKFTTYNGRCTDISKLSYLLLVEDFFGYMKIMKNSKVYNNNNHLHVHSSRSHNFFYEGKHKKYLHQPSLSAHPSATLQSLHLIKILLHNTGTQQSMDVNWKQTSFPISLQLFLVQNTCRTIFGKIFPLWWSR